MTGHFIIYFIFGFLTPSFCTADPQEQKEIFFPREAPIIAPPCRTYDGQIGLCRLLVQCTTFFAEIAQLSRSPCPISENQMGVCCPPTKGPSINPSSVVVDPGQSMFLPQVDVASKNNAVMMGMEVSKQKELMEIDLVNRNIVAPPDSSAFLHAKLFETNDKIIQQSKGGDIIVAASADITNRFHLNQLEINEGLKSVSIMDTVASQLCPPEPLCPQFYLSYRTMDGTCNNIVRRDWGKAGRAFRRKIPSKYFDGINQFRKSVNGRDLPSARTVSVNLSPSVSITYQNLTNLIWQWGQFLDHDITHTPISKGANKADISCCNRGTFHQNQDLHPECRPIHIPETDPFYRRFNQRCMEFVRSMAAIPDRCTFGPRQQINQITSYIDGSNVYGSSDEEAQHLRSFRGGKLKVTVRGGRHLLPPTDDDETCVSMQQHKCFLAGDSRVNEQINLAVMHTIWVRQHNSIVEELARLNPGWSDEILFQEGRRIVIAQMQHITYNEYLPIVLGRQFIETYGLLPLKEGYFRQYDPDVDATIFNAFATAAFRYGHTLISDTLQGFDKLGLMSTETELSANQFVPFALYQRGTLDELLRGLTKQKSQQVDRFFSKELTNKLFSGGKAFGMDLVALNIQRGRDHGIPPYTEWQDVCGLPRIASWRDLRGRMTDEVIAHLRTVYADVNDIDLFIGGISETPVGGSLLGPTFLCIVGQQFIALKIGDRFYYENGGTIGQSGQPLSSSFTPAQLEQIRKTTLTRILCDNSDDIQVMQPLAFVTGHFANKRALCSSGVLIPRMSLDPWANSRIWAK